MACDRDLASKYDILFGMFISTIIYAIISIVFTFLPLSKLRFRDERHRTNAMDLCAWNAASENGTFNEVLYHRIAMGSAVCPFCGQRHDKDWVSRNAWESRINAMHTELNKECSDGE